MKASARPTWHSIRDAASTPILLHRTFHRLTAADATTNVVTLARPAAEAGGGGGSSSCTAVTIGAEKFGHSSVYRDRD